MGESIIEKIFGGSKRAVLVILTLVISAAILLRIPIPESIMTIIGMIYSFYFGAGAGKKIEETIKELHEKAKAECEESE